MLIDLVSNVNELISRYGLDAVRGTVDYVGKYSEVNNIRVGYGDVWFTIDRDHYAEIRTLSRAGDKIAATKKLREANYCSLKEAKDIVENTTW